MQGEVLWRAINILFLLSGPCLLSLPCSCRALVGLEMGIGICQLPGKHQNPAENRNSTKILQHFAHLWWCRLVVFSFPAFKKCLKSNFLFKVNRYFKPAAPLYLWTFVCPVQPCPPMDLQFPVSYHPFTAGEAPSATSAKSPRFKPERVIWSSLVLQVTSTTRFHQAILFLSAILSHWAGRIWVSFIKRVFVLL